MVDEHEWINDIYKERDRFCAENAAQAETIAAAMKILSAKRPPTTDIQKLINLACVLLSDISECLPEYVDPDVAHLRAEIDSLKAIATELNATVSQFKADMQALEHTSALLCEEIELCMPDKPQEFEAQNIWATHRKLRNLLAALDRARKAEIGVGDG